jgi:hypothetical protein
MQKVHLIDTLTILAYTKAGLLKVKEFNLDADQEPKIEFNLSELKE